jgi:hypothetical protein
MIAVWHKYEYTPSRWISSSAQVAIYQLFGIDCGAVIISLDNYLDSLDISS